MSDRILTDLQEDVAERLRADEFLCDIQVITERKGDIASDIASALGVVSERFGKSGACLIVMQTTGRVEFPNIPNPQLEIELAIRVLENPIINASETGTRKAALTLARRVARILHHYAPSALASTIVADNPLILPVADPLAPVAYEVQFLTNEADPDDITKVVAPDISPSSGVPSQGSPITVTMSCATPGAAIYYTTDGTHPWSGGATSKVYTTPITLTAPTLIRAAAYATGMIASNTSCGDFR